MKQARNSDSRHPYPCLKPWPEDCFVQCGGHGIVVEDLEQALENPQETIKTVLGKETTQKHYKTAFFEAFPKNPSCFIRGEGSNIEEAEENAYKKYQGIISCVNHEFERRGRTDGYAYCKHCSYSSTVLDPLTTCVECQTPTAKFHDKNKAHHCMHHYYSLPLEESVGEGLGMVSKEEWQFMFLKNKIYYQALVRENPQATEKDYSKLESKFFHWARVLTYPFKPLFGKQIKTDEELLEMIEQNIHNFFKENKNG